MFAQNADGQWPRTIPPMMIHSIAMGALLLGCGASVGQNGLAKTSEATQQVCQLIAANPPGFHPFAFVPTEVKDKRFKNRSPRISFVVGEDGNVSDVKVVKGTGSPTVDGAVVKSVEAWKYKPQPGCVINMSMAVVIDIR
jgi:TonB family protein